MKSDFLLNDKRFNFNLGLSWPGLLLRVHTSRSFHSLGTIHAVMKYFCIQFRFSFKRHSQSVLFVVWTRGDMWAGVQTSQPFPLCHPSGHSANRFLVGYSLLTRTFVHLCLNLFGSGFIGWYSSDLLAMSTYYFWFYYDIHCGVLFFLTGTVLLFHRYTTHQGFSFSFFN